MLDNVFSRILKRSVFVFPNISPPLHENEIIVCPPSEITPPVPQDWMCVISKLNGRNIEVCGKTTMPILPIPLVKCLCEEERALAGLSACFGMELGEILQASNDALSRLMAALENISKCHCDHPLISSAQ